MQQREKLSFGNPPNHEFATKFASDFDFGLSPEEEARAAELHQEILVFDTLVEVTWYDNFLINLNQGFLNSGGCGSITLGAAGFKNWRGKGEEIVAQSKYWWSLDAMVEDIGLLRRLEKENADQMMICYTAADIRKAKSEKKIGFVINSQNTSFIGNDVDNVDRMFNLGLRICQLSYNNQNLVASGCTEKRESGVSIFGASVIGRMNEIGMVVDTGHCSSLTLEDAIDISEKPIACSHAGVRSLTPKVNRTQRDEALRKLADNGGVLGFVGQPGPVKGSDRCTIQDYIHALDYAVNLMGIDAVGFGLDHYQRTSLETILTAPEWTREQAAAALGSVDPAKLLDPSADGHLGLENNSGYPNITRGLVAKGYSDDDIAKIMGGNYLRLFEEVVG